jgi:hypothetical protein
MKPEIKGVLKAFTMELAVYAGLVSAYAFLVLHFLGGWLFDLFNRDRKWYAAAALALIIAQGFMLEMLSRALLGLIRGKREE